MTHTPGPWGAVDGLGGWKDIFTKHGFRVAAAVEARDARLIAAAPELLEALERVVQEFNAQPHLDFSGVGNDYIQFEVPRIIAKAKGEA